MDNPGLVKPYELITRLFAIPEYKEFDPSLLIFVFFPIMFGMILGDVGYGILIFLVLVLLKKKFRTPGWQQLINVVLIGSVWATIFGIFFGEIFGPLGLWGRIMGHLPEHEIELAKEAGLYFGEGVFGSLGRLGPLGIFPLDRLATNAVLLLIGTSIFIGVIHCSVGSILGIKTFLGYGEKKHAYFERHPVMLLQVFCGLLVLGLILHTINPRLFPEQLEYIINHAEDKLLFIDPTLLPVLAQVQGKIPTVEQTIVLTSDAALPEAAKGTLPSYESFIAGQPDTFEWPALDERTASSLCYTSGTTGHPKGVLYSHRSNVLHAYAGCMGDAVGVSGKDVILAAVPMFHANAWGLPDNAGMTGTKLILPGPKMGDAETLVDLMNTEGVTMAAGVPTVCSTATTSST